MKSTKFQVLSFSLIFVFTFCINGFAAPGDLDATFGTGGIAKTNFGFQDGASQSAIQPDGKILVAGTSSNASTNATTDVSLARYNPDGSLDAAFGTNGKTVIAETGNQYSNSVLLRADGKFYVIGGERLTEDYFFNLTVYLFNSNGTPDTSFGTGGKVSHAFQFSSETNDAAMQTDGKIVVAGAIGGKFTIFRLNTNGSLDTSFNGVGYNSVTASTNYAATAVAIQADGKIVAGSDSWFYTNWKGFWARFNTDGTLEGDLIPTILVRDIAIQPDGKIIFVGDYNDLSRPGITRFNADKTLDKKFGNSGVNTIVGWTFYDNGTISSVFVEPGGRIVVGGTTGYANPEAALARFNSNGFLDFGFGSNGKVLMQIGPGSDSLAQVLRQPDGKIVAVGQTYNGSDYDYFAARYETGETNTLANRTPFDFDGDGRSDLSVFRPAQNVWYQIHSRTSSVYTNNFGASGDIVAPADYNGDGKTDIAIWRPSTGGWWFSGLQIEASNTIRWGASGDIPRPSDYDGDGKADLIVYRPSTGVWMRRGSAGGSSNVTFGISGDKPLIGDFDGDAKADPAIYRPSTGVWWYAASSANGQQRAMQWGIAEDIPAPADYDGDGITDAAVYRPSNGVWYILNSGGSGYTIIQFGLSEDKPISADYDGDGKADIAVWRPSNGAWYLLRSTSGFTAIQWGLSGDVPSQNSFTY